MGCVSRFTLVSITRSCSAAWLWGRKVDGMGKSGLMHDWAGLIGIRKQCLYLYAGCGLGPRSQPNDASTGVIPAMISCALRIRIISGK